MTQWSSDQTRFSLASVEIDVLGTIIRGVQKWTLTDEVSGDPMYGNSSVSIGLPAGQHKAEGAMGLIPEMSDDLRRALGDQWSQVPSTIGITLFEQFGGAPLTYNVTRAYFRKWEGDFGEPGGSKGATENYTITILEPIDLNGLSSIRDQRGGTLFSFPVVLF